MIEVANPIFKSVSNNFVNKYFEYIDVKECVDKKLSKLYPSDPHVTLMYNKEPFIGPNESYIVLKIKYRDLYTNLRDKKKLILPEMKIGIFDTNEGSNKVLYIDVSESNLVDTFRKYNSSIINDYNLVPIHDEYNPHITITYLKGDTSDEVIEDMKNHWIESGITEFNILGFLLSSPDNEENKLIELGG
jgi:2'-5' RNA ligase